MTGTEFKVNDEFNPFKQDNFAERRNSSPSAGVAYDPESLLTEGEVRAGLSYGDKRVWPSQELYLKAVSGLLSSEQIVAIGPRVKIQPNGNEIKSPPLEIPSTTELIARPSISGLI